MYRLIAPFLLALAALAPPAAAEMRLLMFEQAGCHWCERWHEEIGPIYPKTAEGAAAPLKRLNIAGPYPEGLDLASRPQFTPTFVLVRDGRELGRIEGYPGEDFFWGLVAGLIESHAETPDTEREDPQS